MFITTTNSNKNLKNSILINIYLQSADHIALTNYQNKIKLLFNNNKVNFNIITLPTKFKHYYILRSPHVYKKSIETFEERIYSLNFKLNIHNYISYLHVFYLIKFLKYNIPLNINIRIKVQNNVQTTIL